MGFFDNLFGGFFDFNGDGKTTWDEELIAAKILEDIEKESNDSNDLLFEEDDVFFDDGDGLSTDLDDTDS